MSIEAVLTSTLGLIVAPAGCGKTHLIAETLAVAQSKPYLVLTHTTAGVAALKQRLRRLSIPPQNYVVTTLDGWALRLTKFFPTLCPITSAPEQGKIFYPELRRVVFTLLKSGLVHDLIQASYSRLLVDEYQDCDLNQHMLVQALSDALPTVVFGDPMQCIFNFSGPMPNWHGDIESYFPIVSNLNTPWRWINAGTAALGEWILQCRDYLLNRQAVDLTTCPRFVSYKQLTGPVALDLQIRQSAHFKLMSLHSNESILVIGDSKKASLRHGYAQSVNGLDVVEPVDLPDITSFASRLDSLCGLELVECILTGASTLMTNVESNTTLRRVQTILAGRNRTPASPVEQSLVNLAQDNSRMRILDALVQIEEKPGTKIYRRAAFHALKESIELTLSSSTITFREAATRVREQRRHIGDRRISKRAIGSTLLLKGLECDHSIILDAGEMNAQNLYVAISRGAKSIAVFAKNNLVGGS